MKAPKNTENLQKTTPTEPTPSASILPFVKRTTGPVYIQPYPPRYNMSSKDWNEALKEAGKMISKEQTIR